MASIGNYLTIVLSNNGSVRAIGPTKTEQVNCLTDRMYIPRRIKSLPKICNVSCGSFFTVCLDCEGFIWSFGENSFGQLGIGNKKYSRKPKLIEDIPPVSSISCGGEHTLVITKDSTLLSFGNNEYGQLFLRNKQSQSKPQQTSFSHISLISAGFLHSLFQNNKGEIYGCGYNKYGQLGLGHDSIIQVEISPMLKQPPNIVQISCGSYHSLLRDTDGNVFSVGINKYGSLGLGHFTNQNQLQQILHIPRIESICCISSSSYMVDYERNLWSFGDSSYSKLGADVFSDQSSPKLTSIKNVAQIPNGSFGNHFIVKTSTNEIFVMGFQDNRISSNLTSSIWGEAENVKTRNKSARK